MRTILEMVEDRQGFMRCLDEQVEVLERASCIVADAFSDGKKLFICGNGGSAADAQHVAAELVGRFGQDRKGLPAIALTTDTSALTAIANDWHYSYVFQRQLEALGTRGDVLLAISTSGASESVLEAVRHARQAGIRAIGLVGRADSKLAAMAELAIVVGPGPTPVVQERMLAVEHMICERTEELLREKGLV